MSRESARKLADTARTDPELMAALRTLAAKKAASDDARSFASSDFRSGHSSALHSGRSEATSEMDTFRRIYLQSRNSLPDTPKGEQQGEADDGQPSWRRYSTARGESSRIQDRTRQIVETGGINAALVNNKMFFGSQQTGNSEYLGQYDGGVKMARAALATKQQNEESMARAAEQHWNIVAGSAHKGSQEALMQRLRVSGGFDPIDAATQSAMVLNDTANRRMSRSLRKEKRAKTVLGLRLNYPDSRSEQQREAEEFKLTRGMRTKRDSQSARQTSTFELEGCPDRRSSRPIGQEEANRTLIWGPGNAQAKGFKTQDTARWESEIVPLGDDAKHVREYDRLRAGGRLTNAELGFSFQFKDGHDFTKEVCSESDLRRANIGLLKACDDQRRLKFDSDQTRREWKGPVVYKASAEMEAGRKRSTIPGSSGAVWGLEKRLSAGHLVVVPPSGVGQR